MKLKIDQDADALYLHLTDSVVVDSQEVSPGVVLDYNREHELVGVEMLYLSKRNQIKSDSMIEFDALSSQTMVVHEPTDPYPAGENG